MINQGRLKHFCDDQNIYRRLPAFRKRCVYSLVASHRYPTETPVMLIICPGGHDNGYTSTLTALENEQLLGKLVLLQGYNEIANELQKLCLPSLRVDGLFMTQKLSYVTKRSATLSTPIVCDEATAYGEQISPRLSTSSGGRLIDPSLVGDIQSDHYIKYLKDSSAPAQACVIIKHIVTTRDPR
jgi:hypothetical protein